MLSEIQLCLSNLIWTEKYICCNKSIQPHDEKENLKPITSSVGIRKVSVSQALLISCTQLIDHQCEHLYNSWSFSSLHVWNIQTSGYAIQCSEKDHLWLCRHQLACKMFKFVTVQLERLKKYVLFGRIAKSNIFSLKRRQHSLGQLRFFFLNNVLCTDETKVGAFNQNAQRHVLQNPKTAYQQ